MEITDSRLIKNLNLKFPLIVAPMAGGPSSVELVAESSKAGALGSIGAAYMAPATIIDFANQVRVLTPNPIHINLFIPSSIPDVDQQRLQLAILKTRKYREELGLSDAQLKPPYEENFDEQFEAILSVKPQVLSFIFGLLQEEYLKEARKNGIYIIGTATNLEEALKLEESGVDAIIGQGVEAGGHRGIFDASAKDLEIPRLTLLREMKKKLKVPIISGGGIMNSSDIKETLSAGAAAVLMGTAFLATKEAGTSEPYRTELLKSTRRETKTTRAFTGRLARGIVNRFMNEMDKEPNSTLPFPAQNKFTRDLRNTSVQKGSFEFLSLWSGTGEGSLWTGSTAEFIESLFE